MARLPSQMYVIQQNDGIVALYDDLTQDVIVSYKVADANAMAKAQKTIFDSPLTDEDKCFAHLWCGYFYGRHCDAIKEVNNDLSELRGK